MHRQINWHRFTTKLQYFGATKSLFLPQHKISSLLHFLLAIFEFFGWFPRLFKEWNYRFSNSFHFFLFFVKLSFEMKINCIIMNYMLSKNEQNVWKLKTTAHKYLMKIVFYISFYYFFLCSLKRISCWVCEYTFSFLPSFWIYTWLSFSKVF